MNGLLQTTSCISNIIQEELYKKIYLRFPGKIVLSLIIYFDENKVKFIRRRTNQKYKTKTKQNKL